MNKKFGRIITISLAAMTIAGCFGSAAYAEEGMQTLAVQEYEEGIAADRSENAYASAFYGLWSLPVTVGDSETRNIYVYTPSSYYPCCQMLFIAVPEGVSAEEFANQSGWVSVAEENAFGITFLEGEWNTDDPSGDIEYILAAVNGAGTLIDAGSGFRSIVGYGDGGTAVQNFILNYPALFAGAVTFGADDISRESIQAAGDKLSYVFAVNGDFTTTLDTYNKEVKMPVWVINDGNENADLIEYWKTANDVADEGLSNEYAEVYNEEVILTTETANNKTISRVWVSDIPNAAEQYDEEFSSYVWNSFLADTARFSAEPNGGLRSIYTSEEVGMTRETVEVDGTERSWLMYVPEDYDGSEELPLVVALHGFTATSECMMVDSEWWRVAEARNLAVAFPQGLTTEDSPTALPRWFSDSEIETDIAFVDAMLDQICETYNIDQSRIYCTGHSNGGFETDVLGENLTERFAAISNVGGAYSPREYEGIEFEGVYLPSWLIVGEYDLADQSNLSEGTASYSNVMKNLAENGIDPETAKTTEFEDGSYYTLTYYGTEDQIPMVQYSVKDDFNHTYAPEFSWKLWDEFFSKYSRGEDGTLYYCGQPVK